MKKLITICLMMTIGFVSKAQTDGPTKEQTIAFIKDYFKGAKLTSGLYEKGNNTKEFLMQGIDNYIMEFSNENCKMDFYQEYAIRHTIYYEGVHHTGIYKKMKYVIDLSKIESINLLVNIRPGMMNEILLEFKVQSESYIDSYGGENKNSGFEQIKLPKTSIKVSSVTIPINYYTTNDSNFDHNTHNKKILQAFNHLRKLCGAPEPINFDN